MTHHRPESVPHHDESIAMVSASPDRVFALIDDHERLVSHMSKSSWRMGGGHMTTSTYSDYGADEEPSKSTDIKSSSVRITRV